MGVARLLLWLCCKARPLAIATIAALFILNGYFILSLLSSRSHDPHDTPRVHKRSHGWGRVHDNDYHDGSNSRHGFKFGHPKQNHQHHGSRIRNARADHMMMGYDVMQDAVQQNGVQYEWQNFTKFSKRCQILKPQLNRNKATILRTPFRIYVYDLPAEFNTQLARCVSQAHTAACYRADYCGFGPVTSTERGISVHGTWQFNLEVILHHVMLNSPFRTHNPARADVFYMPYYSTHACSCYGSAMTSSLEENIRELQRFLSESAYHKAGKPHLMAIGKTEREHFVPSCPLLKNVDTSLFRVIGVEEEMTPGVKSALSQYLKPLLLAPYPSYGHLDSTTSPDQNLYKNSIANRDRTVFLFLAANQGTSNQLRASVVQNMLSRPLAYRTKYSYKEFLYKTSEKDANFTRYIHDQQGMIEAVWLATAECHGDHHRYTLDWMQRSLFCLQPPGDSPTRKSLYDAIISGCIPVLFKQDYDVRYPFQRFLDYKQFTVSVPEEVVTKLQIPIATYLARLSPSKIKQMQVYMATVSQYLQYSYPIVANSPHKDAVKYLMDEIHYFLKHGW